MKHGKQSRKEDENAAKTRSDDAPKKMPEEQRIAEELEKELGIDQRSPKESAGKEEAFGTGQPEYKDKQIADLIGTLQRLQAEFDNYKKRTADEMLRIQENANCALIAKLLPVIDNFDLALKNLDENLKENEFIKGLFLIHDQLLKVLEDEGLECIETKDAFFDPKLHEAVLCEEQEGCDKNRIIEEFLKGYTFKDKVIRHSKVKVAK